MLEPNPGVPRPTTVSVTSSASSVRPLTPTKAGAKSADVSVFKETPEKYDLVSLPSSPEGLRVLAFDFKTEADTKFETREGLQALCKKEFVPSRSSFWRMREALRDYRRERTGWVSGAFAMIVESQDTFEGAMGFTFVATILAGIAGNILESNLALITPGALWFTEAGIALGLVALPVLCMTAQYFKPEKKNHTLLREKLTQAFHPESTFPAIEQKAYPRFLELWKHGKSRGWSNALIHSYILEQSQVLAEEAEEARQVGLKLEGLAQKQKGNRQVVFLPSEEDSKSLLSLLQNTRNRAIPEIMMNYLTCNLTTTPEKIHVQPVTLNEAEASPELLKLNSFIVRLNTMPDRESQVQYFDELLGELRTVIEQEEFYRSIES